MAITNSVIKYVIVDKRKVSNKRSFASYTCVWVSQNYFPLMNGECSNKNENIYFVRETCRRLLSFAGL